MLCASLHAFTLGEPVVATPIQFPALIIVSLQMVQTCVSPWPQVRRQQRLYGAQHHTVLRGCSESVELLAQLQRRDWSELCTPACTKQRSRRYEWLQPINICTPRYYGHVSYSRGVNIGCMPTLTHRKMILLQCTCVILS